MLAIVTTQRKPNPVHRELQAVWSDGSMRSELLGSEHGALWSALQDASWGGKQFRPDLVLAGHTALGGVQDQAAARVGAAVELLHTAFVVHDDVIDGDDTRRGRPNVSGAFAERARGQGADDVGARHHGAAAGILAGDLALVSAARMVACCGAPASQTERLLELLEDTVHATAAGELADVCLSLPSTGEAARLEEALRVADLKTGVYSFQLPLEAGAILAGAPRELISDLAVIGRLIGIGFQLLDDLLGVFGREELTGKTALSDLREGKPTALMAQARASDDWDSLRPLVGDPELDEDQAARARSLLVGCGARALVQDLADRHLDDALRLAARPSIPRELQAVLRDLVERLRASASSAMSAEDDLGPHSVIAAAERAS